MAALRVTVPKRVFDLTIILLTLPITLPVAALTILALLMSDGRPILYAAPRVGQFGKPFRAWKFRTMRFATDDQGVSGANKLSRVTALGHVLRACRIDELPQVVNVILGQMSLVGPRPPDPRYVQMFPDVYGPVLRCSPGITGLATLYMHQPEERLLATSRSAQDTERLYCRRCIPRKARLDLIYQARQARPWPVLFDAVLLWRTIKVLPRSVAQKCLRWLARKLAWPVRLRTLFQKT